MPFSKVKIVDEIKRLIQILEDNHISIQQAILFGSYAKGTANDWSDIDVALVSEDFSGIRFLDWERLLPYLKKFNMFLEVHPFKSEDFEEDKLFPREILRYGIRIR